MVSQCSNPGCNRPLASLAEGRLFQFEITSISISAVDDNSDQFDEAPQRETVHFWLCSHCASTMTLSLEPLGGLRVLPLEAATPITRSRASVPNPIRDC